MAKDKKELDDDLLTGGKTLSSDADNKKAEKKKRSKSSRHCKASWLHWAAKRPPCRWLSAPRRSRPL